MVRLFNRTPVDYSADQLVKLAPMGSRVAWTNLKGATPFRNENALKLGPDEFAGHPYGILSRAELEMKLAQEAYKGADADYVKRNIFISGVELYDSRP
jgi:hypothetical protein